MSMFSSDSVLTILTYAHTGYKTGKQLQSSNLCTSGRRWKVFQRWVLSGKLDVRPFKKYSKEGVTGDNLFQSCEAVQEVFLFDSKFSVLVNIGSGC